jgi:hypothetical protein
LLQRGERGWLATANNRLAADDYPYPLYGTWPAGHRAARIRQMIEAGLPGIQGTNPVAGAKHGGPPPAGHGRRPGWRQLRGAGAGQLHRADLHGSFIVDARAGVHALVVAQDAGDVRQRIVGQNYRQGPLRLAGGQRPAIRVQVNPGELAARGLNFSDIRNAITAASVVMQQAVRMR